MSKTGRCCLGKYYVPALLTGLFFLALFSCTKRQPEGVDYAPNSPFNPYPPDSANNIEHTTLDVTLRWTATDPNSGDVLTYDVFLDTINPPLVKAASGLSSPSYFMTGLAYNTTYYWKLYVIDDKGVITCGPVWCFTTLPHANSVPAVPVYLYPEDNAAWQYPTLNFNVACSDPQGASDTLYYEFYLGATPQPSLVFCANDTIGSRIISGLDYTSTYYWKMVVRDNHYAYVSGPVYAFTTRDCPWFYKRGLPSPRYGFGTAVVNNRIYVIGGTEGSGSLKEVLEYDPFSDSWTRKADMPTARRNLAVSVWAGKIYAIGGNTSIYELHNNNEAYDPASDSWEVLAPAPASHYWTTAHAVNGNIYFIGSTPSIGEAYSGLYQYSIDTDEWLKTTRVLVYADTISPDSIVVYVDTITTYLRSEPPSKVLYHTSAMHNDLIYVMGGTNKAQDYPAGMDVYHPATNEWTRASDMIGPASAPAATVANGYLYVIGGYDGGPSKRVRKYDPFSDTWFIRSDVQTGRSFLGAAFINNRLYAFGGLAFFPLATMEEYRIELDPKNIGR